MNKILRFWYWTLKRNCRDGNCKQCRACYSTYVERKMTGDLD